MVRYDGAHNNLPSDQSSYEKQKVTQPRGRLRKTIIIESSGGVGGESRTTKADSLAEQTKVLVLVRSPKSGVGTRLVYLDLLLTIELILIALEDQLVIRSFLYT